MAASIGAPRVLLRRLREIMAGPESGQDKLDRTVVQVAANMVAEVCSIYVRRRDGSMELFATEGLKKEAVHKTHLKPGEGLVGQIARHAEPMNLSEAHTHPAFSYRPETGEEVYHSFLGVPILRHGRAMGVLTVQNRTHRQYSDEEVEALQTIAMALAELVSAPEFAVNDTTDGTRRIGGASLSGGIAIGHLVHHEPRVAVARLIADDPDHERTRMAGALTELRRTIDDMLDRGDVPLAGEHRDILEAYRMFAHDRGWNRRLDEAVQAGLTAEAAVERVLYDMRPKMLKRSDTFLRERLHDLDDLSNRLLRVLAGRTTAAAEDLPADAILVARSMGPAELLDYERGKLCGLV
ncbi:MAG: GAF domain-containing protein, partial [Pseudomonadota bacterium]|nr:GAF domain-containing protein [Pseudomonadota bacterium]